jgi:APA family basic amino acid/polyamine antiporter
MVDRERRLGFWPGAGLVIANMIGAGVFLSTGFMAQDLSPQAIMVAWLVGGAIALAGAVAYSALASLIPRSGGEYRILSDLAHPALGYVAGWTSLLVGFSAPIAVDAVAAGSFAQTLIPGLDARWVGAALVVLLTGLHAIGISSSLRTQNALVLLKLSLVVGFTAAGLIAGKHAWPTWVPPHHAEGFALAPFMNSLFYIAFAFSGWNAAIYAAEEFQEPLKDVPRAMLFGCVVVGILYLLVNWVFVVNLTPEEASVVLTYETNRVTLGHLIMKRLIGGVGASVMSAMAIALFVSAMSAMIFAGPRIYAAMARDGFLPRAFAAQKGGAPLVSVCLQGFLSIVLIFTHQLQQVLQNVGAILTLFAALTSICLFRLRFSRIGSGRPSWGALTAALLFVISAGWMLYFGFRGSTHLLGWVAIISAIALGAYRFLPRSRPVILEATSEKGNDGSARLR